MTRAWNPTGGAYRPNMNRTRYKCMYYEIEEWKPESPVYSGYVADIYKASGEHVMYTQVKGSIEALKRHTRYTIRRYGQRGGTR